MVNDHFSQAAIDFFLGNMTSLVFDEFEATMMTKDPAVSMRRMRQQAIETSQKIAIEDPSRERFIGGWTLLSPRAPNTVKTGSFEEVVLLLTDVALYLCRFDWKLDKVKSFERVDLAHLVGVRVGTYVTGTLSAADTDEAKNIGLVVTYKPGTQDVVRTNTRTLSNLAELSSSLSSTTNQSPQQQKEGEEKGDGKDKDEIPSAPLPAAATGILNQGIQSAIAAASKGNSSGAQPQQDPKQKSSRSQGQQPQQPYRKIALKAPYARTSLSDVATAEGEQPATESELVELVAGEIERVVLATRAEGSSPAAVLARHSIDGGQRGEGGERSEGKREAGAEPITASSSSNSIIERGDIVSLAEARKSTGLLEQWGHSIKKLVWA